MQVGLLGIIIIVTLTAGGTFYAATGMQQAGQGALTLTPEVKSYIDSKFATGFGSQVQDAQKVASRIAEMEAKITEIEQIKANFENLPPRSEAVESAVIEQRRKRDETLAMLRQNEINNLRNEIATMCAGVTIKKVGDGGSMPSASSSSSFQNNTNLGGRSNRSSGQGQGLKRLRQGGGGQGAGAGGGGGRRRGGGGGRGN